MSALGRTDLDTGQAKANGKKWSHLSLLARSNHIFPNIKMPNIFIFMSDYK